MFMYYVPCGLEDVCVDLSRKSNNLILSSKNMKIPDVKKLWKKPSLDKTFPNCLKKPSKKTLTRLSAKQ